MTNKNKQTPYKIRPVKRMEEKMFLNFNLLYKIPIKKFINSHKKLFKIFNYEFTFKKCQLSDYMLKYVFPSPFFVD